MSVGHRSHPASPRTNKKLVVQPRLQPTNGRMCRSKITKYDENEFCGNTRMKRPKEIWPPKRMKNWELGKKTGGGMLLFNFSFSHGSIFQRRAPQISTFSEDSTYEVFKNSGTPIQHFSARNAKKPYIARQGRAPQRSLPV